MFELPAQYQKQHKQSIEAKEVYSKIKWTHFISLVIHMASKHVHNGLNSSITYADQSCH